MGLYKVTEMWVRWRLAAGGCTSTVGVTFHLSMGEGEEQEESDGGEQERTGGKKKKHLLRRSNAALY